MQPGEGPFLLNVLFFAAPWFSQFKEKDIVDGLFSPFSGPDTACRYMKKREKLMVRTIPTPTNTRHAMQTIDLSFPSFMVRFTD